MVLENILYFLLSKNNGLIIHSSAIGEAQNGYLFVGKSGAGKSTIAKLLSTNYTALTDDTTILRKIKNQIYIFQHPFIEKNYYPKSENSYLLKGIFFLSKKGDFKLKKLIDKEHIFIRLVKQLTVSDISTLQNLMKLVSNFDSFYTLSFSKNRNKMIKFFKSEIS